MVSYAPSPFELHVDAAGRVVIPAAVRRSCGLEPGAALTLRPQPDGTLILEPRLAALRRAQAALRAYGDAGELWSETLMAARREEARREFDLADGD